MPLTLKAINAELTRLGHTARVEPGGGYFYFFGGDAADWLDRTVRVPKVSSLTLAQWMAEFDKLAKLNAEIFGAAKAKQPAKKGKDRRPPVPKS